MSTSGKPPRRRAAAGTGARAAAPRGGVAKPARVRKAPSPAELPKPGLGEYRRKRNFGVTPEPAPETPAPRERAADRATFMVHKHDARRLHYDLRLEMDGALASWAVPKGPSYDPAIRRLAVQTEDHPLAYGGFEGRIPDGEYGAGDSIIWDRGTYETVPPGRASAMRQKGHVEFVLHGEKLHGRWHLIRTRARDGKAEWLLFKAHDEHASTTYDVVADRPESVVSGRSITRGPTPARVVHATSTPIEVLLRVWPPPDADDSGAGERALAAVAHGRVALQSAEGRDRAAGAPDVVAALARVRAVEAVLDGRLSGARSVKFAPQDLLWLDGADLRERPAAERRELLRVLLASAGDADETRGLIRPPARGKPKAGAARPPGPGLRR